MKSQCLVITKYRLTVNTYLLHGPEKLTGSQLVKKFPALYANRGFIIAFTRARHVSHDPPISFFTI